MSKTTTTIDREFDKFIELLTGKKDHVTTVSAKLFASHWEEKQAKLKELRYPSCNICGFEFDEETMDRCFHFSGVINGKKNNHIHTCGLCLEKYDLNADFNFDERVSEIDGTK